MSLAILLSIVALICFGIANTLQKPAIDKLGTLKQIIFRGYIISSITFVAAIFLTDFSHIYLVDILVAILVSTVSYFGFFFFCLGLKHSKPGIIIPISSSRIVFTTLFAALFFQHQISISKYIFMFVILMGIVLISIDFKAIKHSLKSKGTLYALLGGLLFGVSFPFFGYCGNKVGIFLFTFILETNVILVSTLQSYLNNRNVFPLPSKTEIKSTLGLMLSIGILGAAASIAQNIAYSIGDTAIVAAITGCSSLVAVVFARIYLKDKITILQYIAAIIIVIGIVGISLAK